MRTRLGLDPRVLRLTAFASDVAQARTEDELRGSMERFLDQSSDVAMKRTGPPERRFFVNGYVSGSFETKLDNGGSGFSLQVPLGLELVWRRETGKPDQTNALFLRLVDLGGFVPGESPDEGRSTDELIASLVRPGLFFMRGFSRGLPLTVGAGITVSLVPEQGQPDTTSSWEWRPRASILLGWDIPIFP